MCDRSPGQYCGAIFPPQKPQPYGGLWPRVSVFVKDYSTQNYLCQEDGEPLTRRKKAVLDRIMQMGLPGGEDGETVLCSHDITFRAGPSILELDAAALRGAAPAKSPGRI